MITKPATPLSIDDPGKALMLRVKLGDVAAFTELVETHKMSVIRFAANMLGSNYGAGEGEDIAQQVFIKVWKSAVMYEPTGKFTTWLFTVTRNLVINEIRKKMRRPIVHLPDRPDESRPGESWETVADPEAKAPVDLVLRTELESVVDKAMLDLSENQRAALLLRRVENMPYEDIADTLGISLQSVKSLLFRARNHMKSALSSYLG